VHACPGAIIATRSSITSIVDTVGADHPLLDRHGTSLGKLVYAVAADNRRIVSTKACTARAVQAFSYLIAGQRTPHLP
jgi:hypothetical protein